MSILQTIQVGSFSGVIMELEKGRPTLIVSAYMPSGLDHCHAASDSTQLAHALYAEMLQWTRDIPYVIIMGDLNQTLTRLDRNKQTRDHTQRPSSSSSSPSSTAASASSPSLSSSSFPTSSPIHCLIAEHFTDIYRLHHPDASLHPGFTHEIISDRRCTRSRIDYIWSRGFTPHSHLNTTIDKRLHRLSHHHLLWMELQLQTHDAYLSAHHLQQPPPYRLQLPNLRTATDQHREYFIHQLEKKLTQHQHERLQSIDIDNPSSSLSSLASQLTSFTHCAAVSSFPLTGAAPYRTKSIFQLHRKRRDLISLLHTATVLHDRHVSLVCNPEWVKQYRLCIHHHRMQWKVDVYYHHDDEGWINETKQYITDTRRDIRRESKRMMRQKVDTFDASPAATIHRMLQSDALPSHLYSVVTNDGHLTTNAIELEDCMVQHFESVFAIPPHDDHHPLHRPPPDILFNKPHIQSQWYDGLMNDVSEEELLTSLKHIQLISSPGEDQVSSGVWKIAITGSAIARRLISQLFTACLQTSTFPSTWKTSVIVPLVKDTNKERVMTNIRPISLQSCLGKLLNNILAQRLSSILSRHPILNPSQRGFIIGGATLKCIDELLDAWDWSRNNKKELYTLFYDIKQAYDSVQAGVMVRALHRINLPLSFINLIHDSLTGLSSCIRTAYGITRHFPVKRSLRQGDPLAPLLFVILMDALHDGLEVNPFTGLKHGCVIDGKMELSSLGYADDTAVLTNNLHDLRVQNEWVQYFMSFNLMRLNPLKCDLVGRAADGTPVTHAAITSHHIQIDQHLLQPIPHHQPIRYLGIHSCFDGSWLPQQNKSRDMILVFTRIVRKFNVPISQAIYMFNVFLLPKLELALHYVHGPGTTQWIKQLDCIIIGCIKHIASSPIHLSHSALALTLHLNLPSWLEVSIKVSELFLRMNSTDNRWAPLGRIIMQQQCTSNVDIDSSFPRPDAGTRLTRAAYLAVHKLQWSLHLNPQQKCYHRRPDSRRRRVHLFNAQPIDFLPTMAQYTTAPLLTFIDHSTRTLVQSRAAQDTWSGWGKQVQPMKIDAYTDGSFDPISSTSSWSVVPSDAWLHSSYGSIPSDEHLLYHAHVGGAPLFGCSIRCTQGVYPAELQAIARTLAMFPLSFDLHIHVDSLSALTAIRSYQHQLNPRQRLRMSARPLLQLIHHLIHIRREAGGSINMSHVKAHTNNVDLDSVGNRLADYQANLARTKSDRSWPLGINELPLSSCEHHLHIKSMQDDKLQVIDDIRRTSLTQLQSQSMLKWTSKVDDQGYLASPGMVELGRIVLKYGSSSQQITMIHVATNSIHYHWFTAVDGTSSLQQLQCASCHQTMSLNHLITCPHVDCISFRHELQQDIINLLTVESASSDWLRDHHHSPLSQLLQTLFPMPGSVASSSAAASSSAPKLHHLTRILTGSFTSSESNAASKLIGLTSASKLSKCAPSPLNKLRLLCLDHISQVYNKWKT